MNPVPGIKSKGRLGEDWAQEWRNLFVCVGTTQSADGVNLFPSPEGLVGRGLVFWWMRWLLLSILSPLTQVMVVRDLILQESRTQKESGMVLTSCADGYLCRSLMFMHLLCDYLGSNLDNLCGIPFDEHSCW